MPEILALLEIAESMLSRSTKDIFPFHLREVERYHQLAGLLAAVESWLDELARLQVKPSARRHVRSVRKCLGKLEEMLRLVVDDPAVAVLVAGLEDTNAVFCEVREVLGRTGKSGEEVRADIVALLAELGSDPARAAVLQGLEKRFKRYNGELYMANNDDRAPRTNNDLKYFNKRVKRPIRKNHGQEASWFYLEHEGAAVALYHNLLSAPHEVGGTSIKWPSEGRPLERLGVIRGPIVTEIASLVSFERLRGVLVQHEKNYAVHRWTRRVNKLGLGKCLQALLVEWGASIIALAAKNS
ncbi:MAG: hypothetical protein ACTSU5_02930 [Promethearchaeota archaeon]